LLSNWLGLGFLEIIPIGLRVLATFGMFHLGAAYCLARLIPKDDSDVVAGTVVWACILFMAYFVIAYLIILPVYWLTNLR